MTAEFTLHGVAPSGPTYKVALMLSLCGQPFRYRHVNLRGGAHKQPDFLELNRYGQVPVLQHDGRTLVQSGSILGYLAETLGKLGGGSELERQQAREWLFWDADILSPGIYVPRGVVRGFLKVETAVLDWYRARGERGLATLDGHLGGRPFLTGAAPTIGDVACYGGVAFAHEGEFDLARWPHVQAWAGRMAGLPGAKAPYDLLPMEDRDRIGPEAQAA